jgi:hypothetical protein
MQEHEITPLLQAMLDVDTIVLLRMKSLISALEEKGLITKAEVDCIQDSTLDHDAQAAIDKVRTLFRDLVTDYSTNPRTP